MLIRQYLAIGLLIAGVPACRRSSKEDAPGTGTKEATQFQLSQANPKLANPSPDQQKRSLLGELRAIEQSGLSSDEVFQKSREYLKQVAKQRGLSVPQLVAESLAELLPNPGDKKQTRKLTSLCFGDRDEMIELIQNLPTGEFRTNAVITYGAAFVEKNDLGAIKSPYESISPGKDRTILASLGSQAAYLSATPDESLRWIESLEYPEEKKVAIENVGSLFKQGLGKPADRAAFLSELQRIAKENGVTPPTGKFGTPLQGGSNSQGEPPW